MPPHARSPLSAEDYLDALEEGAGALADALGFPGATPVPTCPGWDLAALGAHVGLVYARVSEQVRLRARAPIDRSTLPQPPATGRSGWLRGMAGLALGALRSAGDAEPAGLWRGRAVTASFWRRRLAHETLIHRVDADISLKRPPVIPPDLVIDGIDEIVDTFLPTAPQRSSNWPPPGVLTLADEDAAVGWTLRAEGAGIVALPHLGRRPATAETAAIVAPAESLLLICWGRQRPAEEWVAGDRRVLESWLACFRW